ncbi:hypothetical protein LASUN_11310 [Lentilactobacillus sunkii]|jgi:hypothetical protein|uniref:D-alanyl-D-alanine carboxypeptidase n=2 Tax=Lentilactobacillus sunkii TaxID=481719 RepID=A0A1E7XDK6_9LACO|nr:hypothetical protein LASUN_11310 [Lentilactobacillus sunkii]
MKLGDIYMKFKSLFSMIVAGTSLGIGMTMTMPSVSANGYQRIKTSWESSPTWFQVKSQYKHKKVYMWNSNHTKKILQLNNYPNSNWNRNHTYTYKHNGKLSVYYGISGWTPKNHYTRKGIVWGGYLRPGYNTNYKVWNNLQLGRFSNNQEYAKYIQESPSQRFSKKVLKLFPNTPLSWKLSSEWSAFPIQTDPTTGIKSLPSFTDVIVLQSVNKYFDRAFYKNNVSDSQRLKLVKKALDNAGYDQAKRNTLSDYQIGIFYYDKHHQEAVDEYPGIILAKPIQK